MTELPESPGTGPHRTGAEGGDGRPDVQDRPKLVAVPGSGSETAVPAPPVADAVSGDVAAPDPAAGEPAAPAVSADAARLQLERSLSGPYATGPLHAGAADAAAVPAVGNPGSVSTAARVQPDERTDAIAATGTPALVAALRSELAMRATAEAGLRTRVVEAETRLAARVLFARRTAETLQELRAEFDQLAELLTDERARRQAADRRVAELERELAAQRGRSDDADREIAGLRDSLAQLPTLADASAPSDGEPHGDAGAVRPDRLSDALTRLRASTEPIGPEPAAAAPAAFAPASAVVPVASTAAVPTVESPGTLAGPFRSLCRRDPMLAGRLAVSLLGLQATAYPHPIAYDVVLGPGHGCIQVTSDGRAAEVVRQPTARPLAQVDLQLAGTPERFAKLLVAGTIRRRLGFGVSRVRGNRAGLVALDALLALPLDLPALADGGMSSDLSILAQLQGFSKRAQSD